MRDSMISGRRTTAETSVLVAFIFAFILAPIGRAEHRRAIDFLYIDSATGHATGGHAAIRLGETIFHFRYAPGGLLLLETETWERWRHLYNDADNRSISLSRAPVSDATYDRVRAHFFDHYVRQKHRFRVLAQMTEDEELLRRFAAGDDAIEIEGLGFFSPTDTNSAAVDLKARVEANFGDGWLEARRRDANAARIRESVRDAPPGWAVRLREQLAWCEALKILADARRLADDALINAEGATSLTERERAVAEEFVETLVDSVLALLASDRPDRGTALLVQVARIQAWSRSLETGALTTLDPFSARAKVVPADTVARRYRDERLLVDAREEVAAFREAFVADGRSREIAYARIEAALGRLSELERATRSGASIRVEEGLLLPSKPRAVRSPPTDGTDEIERAATIAERNRDRELDEAQKTYRYHLLTRNCVTELVRCINESFGGPEEALERLGGWLEPGEPFLYIPCRLTPEVESAFPASETELMKSYRLRQLDRLVERRGSLTWFRENNTLTSTLYDASATDDGVFLFFTDDVILPRPLLGAANFAYAGVHGVGGLLLAPFDRARLLWRSVRGMFYSLPEVFFFNIRKGSFPLVLPRSPEEPTRPMRP